MSARVRSDAASPLCLCGSRSFRPVFTYDRPPEGETRFDLSEGGYHREVVQCERCGHFVSQHGMDMADLYAGEYVSATYGDDGIRAAFERITAMPAERSDNAGRARRVREFASARSLEGGSILDVGSGLCVFLDAMKRAGWRCTALDPDVRAVRHARDAVGVDAIHADFMQATGIGPFDVISFNKVLEHVQDPIAMLSRARRSLDPRGFVYVEVPDGEEASRDGPGREEFFIEHHHVFSAASLAVLATRAGFSPAVIERLREPSGKYTLRAFMTLTRH